MTSNPMAQSALYQNVSGVAEKPMTISGAINKTVFLLIIAAITAIYTWNLAMTGFMDKVTIFIFGGMIAGFVLAIIMRFKPEQAKILSIGYAVCEGLVLGGISAIFETQFKGIVLQAVGATFITLFSMLFLYKTGIIKATETFKKVVITATMAIFVFYLINAIALFFGANFPSIFNSGILGIGISLFICVVASLNFILDFDFIEQGAANYAPKYFEWFGAFAMLVTLVWLYIEILRLLSMLRNDR